MAEKTNRDVSGVTSRIKQAHNPGIHDPQPGMENQTWSEMTDMAGQNQKIRDWAKDKSTNYAKGGKVRKVPGKRGFDFGGM